MESQEEPEVEPRGPPKRKRADKGCLDPEVEQLMQCAINRIKQHPSCHGASWDKCKTRIDLTTQSILDELNQEPDEEPNIADMKDTDSGTLELPQVQSEDCV